MPMSLEGMRRRTSPIVAELWGGLQGWEIGGAWGVPNRTSGVVMGVAEAVGSRTAGLPQRRPSARFDGTGTWVDRSRR
jgi:hypothetical protein